MSLIEAQSSLKPIVSTRVGGINNVVLENKTALLSNVGDYITYSSNLISLIENQKLRQAFSIAGNHIYDKYNYQRLVKDMKTLYDEILTL